MGQHGRPQDHENRGRHRAKLVGSQSPGASASARYGRLASNRAAPRPRGRTAARANAARARNRTLTADSSPIRSGRGGLTRACSVGTAARRRKVRHSAPAVSPAVTRPGIGISSNTHREKRCDGSQGERRLHRVILLGYIGVATAWSDPFRSLGRTEITAEWRDPMLSRMQAPRKRCLFPMYCFYAFRQRLVTVW